MDSDQLYQYVRHRMLVAGYKGHDIFSLACCKLMFKASKGTPRVVNVLCHKALMLAYGEGKQQVSEEHIRLAIQDTEAAVMPRKVSVSFVLLATASIMCICGGYLTWVRYAV
jgi:MSHA biogenesis protein MshM